MSGEQRIAKFTLNEKGVKRRSPEAEHERNVALTDLLHDNVFQPTCMKEGPYEVGLGIEEGRLVMDVFSPQENKNSRVVLPITSLRGIIRDYFMICESYYEALKKSPGPGKLEAIDMGRRGVHNEGSVLLKELLENRISVDHQTARRLFTLICVLHIK